ncbi:MAG: hypothetical protein WC683_05930 [bacterium]
MILTKAKDPEFPTKLTAAMDSRSWSVQDLTDQINALVPWGTCRVTAVYRWRKGIVYPSHRYRQAIRQLLGI